MSNFSLMLNNLPEYFKKYYDQIVGELELNDLTEQEQLLVEHTVHQMFLDAVNLACAKALSEEQMARLEAFLDIHPDATIVDIYFSAASHQENIDELVNLELQNAVIEAKKIYNELGK